MIPLGGNSTAVRKRASVKFFDALLGFTSRPLPAEANTLGWESPLEASELCAATEGPRVAVIAADFHAGIALKIVGIP